MSTQLTETPTGWLVSTVSSEGTQKKTGRGAVRVPKGDVPALRAEIIRQADELRVKFGVQLPLSEPVV